MLRYNPLSNIFHKITCPVSLVFGSERVNFQSDECCIAHFLHWFAGCVFKLIFSNIFSHFLDYLSYMKIPPRSLFNRIVTSNIGI